MTKRTKELRTIVMMCLAAALMLFVFASCNTVPENNIPTETPKASATVSATSTPEATGDMQSTQEPEETVAPSDDVTPDESATAGTTETPVESNDTSATVTPSATQSATATVKPSATQKPTATKAPTATKKPTATNKPTATPKPTATQNKEVYQTITYEGKEYKVLMGRNGNPYLIKDYSTLPPILQAYAYPTFDIETVMMDIYKYAKTKGFGYFYNPNAPLKTNPNTELALPESFVPGGSMTEDLALEAFSWDSPSFYTYPGDSFYKADYTELDGIIETREFYPDEIDFLAMTLKDAGRTGPYTLALWIQDYGDSSYCENDPVSNGLYNGKYTREYAMYFMYGGRTTLIQEVII